MYSYDPVLTTDVRHQVCTLREQFRSWAIPGEDANGKHAQGFTSLDVHGPITDHDGALRCRPQAVQRGLEMGRVGFHLRDAVAWHEGLSVDVNVRECHTDGSIAVACHNA